MSRIPLMFGLLLSGFLPAAVLAQADVAVVSGLRGVVTFTPPGAKAARVTAYMRLREGDLINLPGGAEIRVAWFEGGRQEAWMGVSGFRVARAGSEPVNGAPVQVVQLPATVPQRIARVPQLVQNAKLGGIQVRGLSRPPEGSPDEARVLREAREVYEQLRKLAGPEDITPELFLYATLHEYLRYEEMRPVVEEMRRKQPGNEDVRLLADWVAARLAGR